jgi:S1-C subfamily serine protease
MRVVVLFLLALLVGCSSQPKLPSKVQLVSELQSSTVGLVRLSLQIELTPEEIKIEPVTRVFCSGVWVSGSSIVTAQHCVDEMQIGEELAYVVQSDVYESEGKAKKLMKVKIAKLAAVDPEHDLAILRALVPPPHEVAPLSLENIAPGMAVHTMGHPLGMWFSYSSGEVSAVRRMYMPAGEDDPIGKDTLWVQTFAPISPGNSGGGLFDEYGRLLGICSRGRRDGQGLNFYIHRDHIAALLHKQATL